MTQHKIGKNDTSPVAEAYRKVRTNLQFMNLDHNLKKVIITSAGPSEGKSSVIGNLGLSLAGAGHRVLIVDCDYRKPKQHRFFELSNIVGAIEVMLGEEMIEDVIQNTVEKNLDVLTTGQTPPNPSEVLGSKRFQEMIEGIEGAYDFVLFDTPPVGMVTDAAVVSRLSDGVILVAAVGQEDIRAIESAQMQLQDVGAKILGVIMNKVPVDEGGYYGYIYNHYYYGEKQKGRRRREND